MKLKQIFVDASLRLKKHNPIVSKIASIFAVAVVLVLSTVSAYASTQSDSPLLSGANKWYIQTYNTQDSTSYVPKGSTGGNLIIWDLLVSISATYGDEDTTADTFRYCNGWLYFNLTFNFSYSFDLTGYESYSLEPAWTAPGVTAYCESIARGSNSATFAIFIQLEDFVRVRVANALTFNLHVSGTHATQTMDQMTYSVTRNSYLNKTTWSAVPKHQIDTTSIVDAINEVNASAADIDRIVGLLNTKLQSVLTNSNQIKSDLSEIKEAVIGEGSSSSMAGAASGLQNQSDILSGAESGLSNSATLAPEAISGITSDSIDTISSISTSMTFWGRIIAAFGANGGIFWSVLLVGLAVGLFAFILRLR